MTAVAIPVWCCLRIPPQAGPRNHIPAPVAQMLVLYTCAEPWASCPSNSVKEVVIDDQLGPFFDVQKYVQRAHERGLQIHVE